MTMSPTAALDRVTGGRGAKLLRYSAVSVVGIVVSQLVLVTCYGLLDMSGITSNVVAVSVSAVPAFVLNKRWVWGHNTRTHFRREVLPFWVFTLAGLLLSTVFVGWVDSWTEATLLVSAASLSGFGVLWIAKFLFLEKVMFGEQRLATLEPTELEPA